MRIFFLILIWMIIVSHIQAQTDWLCPCEYRQEIEVSENSGSTLNDFQVRLELTYQSGMANDFSDLRFTNDDGLTILDHWVEYFDSSNEAVVWVELDLLPSNATSDFFMYYGTCGTDLSDGVATMVFYDDMNSSTGWTSIGSNSISFGTFDGASTLNKQINCDPNGGWKSIGTTLNSFRMVAREYRASNGPTGCDLNSYGLESDGFDGYTFRRDAVVSGSGPFGYERRNNGSGSNFNSANAPQPFNNWYRTELSRCGNGSNNMEAIIRDDGMNENGIESGTDNRYKNFTRVTVRGGRDYYIDYMAVAKKICDEPTVAFGDIDDCPDATVLNVAHDVCIDGTGEVTIQVSNGTPPYTISWTPNVGTPGSPQIISSEGGTLVLTGLDAGTTLTFDVEDANGCKF